MRFDASCDRRGVSSCAGPYGLKAVPALLIPLFAIWTAGAADAPITSNPIPEPILKRGLAVEIRDLVRLPDTRGVRAADQDVSPAGWARISYVRDLPDGAGTRACRVET